jgi:hypothetical protein
MVVSIGYSGLPVLLFYRANHVITVHKSLRLYNIGLVKHVVCRVRS